MTNAPPKLTGIKHVFRQALVQGTLLKRYKRFLADVQLADGQIVTCHCPNSGSMLGCAEPGWPVALSHNPDPKRKTAYTWQMVQVNKTWVGINTGLANPLILQAAQKNMPPFFTEAMACKPEVKINEHTRLDMLVKKAEVNLYVEVKSVTLVENGLAMFPDAVTTRGRKHLRELARLSQAGHEALIVYLVQRADCQHFTPARHIDPTYADEFSRAVDAGVRVLVWQARVSPRQISLWRQLPWTRLSSAAEGEYAN